MRVYTVKEAAQVLQLNEEVVRRKLRKGELPGKRIGRDWRILEDDLKAFLRSEGTARPPETTE